MQHLRQILVLLYWEQIREKRFVWHDIGKKQEWVTYYVSLEVFYLGTKVFKLLDFCTPLISDPHSWESNFSFWFQCFSMSFHCEKNFKIRSFLSFFCQFEVRYLHWNYFQEESIYCAVLMEILSRLSFTVWLRSQTTGFHIAFWLEKLEDELFSAFWSFSIICVSMS